MSLALNHVLIVDENKHVRTEVRRLLSQAKVAPPLVSEASLREDATKAYQAPSGLRPNLIIMAVDLCGERGDEWLTSLRGDSPLLHVPVVLLGQDEDDARIEAALSAGAYAALHFKRLSAPELRRVLKHVTNLHTRYLDTYQSEAQFRALVDSAPTLMWVSDVSGARVYFNRPWLEFTGRRLEEQIGEGWLASLHPDDRERTSTTYRQAFARREPYEVEYRMRRHDGVYRWILARGQARKDVDGTFLGYTGSCLDISERRAAEEEAKLSEERLRLVLYGSPITVMTTDRQLRYTWIHNPQAGFVAADLLGKRDDEIFAPEVAKPFLAFKREVLETESTLQRELDLVSHGVLLRFDTRAEPLRDHHGTVVGLTLVAINITPRIRIEERAAFLAEASHLLASSLDYETTLQQVTNAMVPRLADWCSVDIVDEAGEIIQVAVAHVDPAKVEWAKQLRKHNPPSIDDPGGLALVLRTGKSEFYPEIPPALIEEAIRLAETDEQREAVRSVGFRSVIIVPLQTRSQILGAITLVWSDSDRRYDEADLLFAEELAQRAATAVDHARLYRESQERAEAFRQLSETLEQQVDARTAELQRSNQDLDQFAYIASHDLKAPLRAIDHLSTWVLEDVGHLLPDRSHEHLEKMRSRIKRMEGLLDDLLTYSRAGRFRGDTGAVDVDELMARVVETVAPPEGIAVEVDNTPQALYTYAAPLETVLRNLINNAIKHHDKPAGVVRVSARDLGEVVEFSVSDDGPGIDPAYHDRIFQMFQTLRPRDQVEGSGMGLAVVDKIISNVGGTIDLESTPGQGATFRFTWPRDLRE